MNTLKEAFEASLTPEAIAQAEAKREAEREAEAEAKATARIAKANATASVRAKREAEREAKRNAKAEAKARAKAEAEAIRKAREVAEARAEAERNAEARAEAEAKKQAEAEAQATRNAKAFRDSEREAIKAIANDTPNDYLLPSVDSAKAEAQILYNAREALTGAKTTLNALIDSAFLWFLAYALAPCEGIDGRKARITLARSRCVDSFGLPVKREKGNALNAIVSRIDYLTKLLNKAVDIDPRSYLLVEPTAEQWNAQAKACFEALKTRNAEIKAEADKREKEEAEAKARHIQARLAKLERLEREAEAKAKHGKKVA